MSDKTYIPEHYAPLLNLYDTQKAISLLRRVFEDTLCGLQTRGQATLDG